MFRNRPILETLEIVASPEEWQAYEPVRHVDPPPTWSHGFPGQHAMFAAREETEALILVKVRAKLERGDWTAIGRWNDAPTYTQIDQLLWPKLEFDLAYDRVLMERSRDFFCDLHISEVRPTVQSLQEKAEIARELKKWFASLEKAGEGPRRKNEWQVLAERKFPGLTDNLFNGVWRRLGHPHTLKHDGRPTDDKG